MSQNYKLQPWERQAIVDAYRAGEKTATTAKKFGVTSQYVGMLARRYGCQCRPIGRPITSGHARQ